VQVILNFMWPSASGGPALNVLIADDDAVSRRLLESQLHKWGYAVTCVPDGLEAWRLFEAGDFRLVLTDWMMPGLDGLELVRRIRAAGRPGYVYVILLTARAQKQDMVEGMEAGADEFLTKPFDRDELHVRLRAGERIVRLEEHLAQTRAALAQAETLAGLGRLAAGIAHEINNPVAIVSNNLTVLHRDAEAVLRLLAIYRSGRQALARIEPERAAQAERLEEEIDLAYVEGELGRLIERSLAGLQRIGAIVANLRDFARLDEAEWKSADVNTGLAAAAEVLGHEFERRGVQLRLTPQPLPSIHCQPAKINQALLNVILNAVQACTAGGVVEVQTRPDPPSAVLIEVQDTGAGIKPEHLPRIFEPFFTTRPVGQGAGLGLAVAYGIVRAQGGNITAESEPGRGSLFRIRLPVAGPGAAV
jgi:two-component system NtrC family sensor kinase